MNPIFLNQPGLNVLVPLKNAPGKPRWCAGYPLAENEAAVLTKDGYIAKPQIAADWFDVDLDVLGEPAAMFLSLTYNDLIPQLSDNDDQEAPCPPD